MTLQQIKEHLEPENPNCYGTGGNNVPLVLTPIAYSLDSKDSNSMKSDNPISGCRETDKSRTLDTTNPDPSKNQGGIAIVQESYCIASNTINRQDHKGGNGQGIQKDISFTLTTSDVHAIYKPEPYQDVVGTLCISDWKGAGNQLSALLTTKAPSMVNLHLQITRKAVAL